MITLYQIAFTLARFWISPAPEAPTTDNPGELTRENTAPTLYRNDQERDPLPFLGAAQYGSAILRQPQPDDLPARGPLGQR